MNGRRPQVVYAFPTSHRFREPFHNKLRETLATRGIDYEYIYASNVDDNGKGDLKTIGWAKNIPQYKLYVAGREVIWQPLLRAFRHSDLFIVQQENRHLVNYILTILAPLTGKRLAFFGHGRNFQSTSPKGPAESWKRFWATKVHWWFGYTELTSNMLTRYGYPRERITIFNNAIDTVTIKTQRAQIDRDSVARRRARLVDGSKNVGVYVGGMYSEKRIPFLINVAREIRARMPDFHLLVIGAGPDAHLIEEMDEDWIHYMGPVFGIEKTELVELARVWLMPGLVGLAVLDSFAHEIPMVTCALPFHSPEIAYLEDGVNGLIVEDADDSDAYAASVVNLLNDETYRLALVAGAAVARDTFTIEAMVERFAEGVQLALNSHRTR